MYVKLKHVNKVRSKGHTYYYHRRTGERLPDDPVARVKAVLRINASEKVDGPEPTAAGGTMAHLVQKYRSSPEYKGLADSTRKDYGRYLKFYESEFGDLAVKALDREFVLELRDSYADTPRKADYLIQILSMLCAYAMDRPRQYRLSWNPAAKIKRIAEGKAYMPWPDNLISKFRKTAYKELVWVVEAGLYTGQRESDCIQMAWPHYDGEGIDVVQDKGGQRLWIPAHDDLKDVLKDVPRKGVVMLTTKTGRPWKVDHLRHEITKHVRKCGFDGYSFHGLRSNAAKNLAEAGATDHQIASVTGHKTLAMVQHYTKAVRQRTLAKQAIAKLPRKKKRTKLQNPADRTAKPGKED